MYILTQNTAPLSGLRLDSTPASTVFFQEAGETDAYQTAYKFIPLYITLYISLQLLRVLILATFNFSQRAPVTKIKSDKKLIDKNFPIYGMWNERS